MSVLVVHSHYGPAPFAEALAKGLVNVVRERELGASHFAAASGLITTTHLDQIGFMAHADALIALLNRGGRWVFDGHILRRFVHGLGIYVPIQKPKRSDYALTRLSAHAVFDGIPQRDLEENKGVAGFYGRGHNPLPFGGLAINGIGPDLLPVDWEWQRPEGGRIFSHAGNDLGGMGSEQGHGAVLTERLVSWSAGEIG